MSNIYQRHRRRVHRSNLQSFNDKCKNYKKAMMCRSTRNMMYNFYYKPKEDKITKILKTPVYINRGCIRNDKDCTNGFRKYYENLLRGDSKSILKEKCVKILLFVNKKNLKIFMGYSPKCGLYILVKSPLLDDNIVLPCDDAELLEQIEDLKEENEHCRGQVERLQKLLSNIKNGDKYVGGNARLYEQIGVSRYMFI